MRQWAHRAAVQDTALACGLLVLCGLVNRPYAAAVTGGPDGDGGRVALWWSATALMALAVALRRRRPVAMLSLGTVAVAAHLALPAPPMVVDLGVLVLLSTVAAHRGRAVSFGALVALLLLTCGWSVANAARDRPVPGAPVLSLRVQHRDGAARTDAGTAGTDDAVAVTGPGGRSNLGTALSVFGSVLVAAWAVGAGARHRRAFLEQLRQRANDLERERDQRAALAVADERGRISRELHDVVAHGLSMMVIQAQGGTAALDDRPADTRSALEAIVTIGRDSLADMRRVLGALGEVDDAWHPQPGLGQLPALLDRVRRAGTPVRLRIDGEPTPLPSTVNLSAYRIVQEALTNTMKHAGPDAHAEVVVSYRTTALDVEVSDDGRGGTAAAATRGGAGGGLRGMRERARLLGGQLAAGPGPVGFVVRATLPLDGSGGRPA